MNCLLIKKNCDLVHKKLDNELYYLCGFKNSDNFGLRFTWHYNNYFISLYSKSLGNAGNENKYDLPPPLDNKLYFGNIIIIAHKNKNPNNKNILNFTLDDWNKFYNYAFGGFEDINDTSEEEEEEEEEVIPLKYLTETGYSKESGFIADDNEDIELLSDYSEEIMNDSDYYISDSENGEETEDEDDEDESEQEDEDESEQEDGEESEQEDEDQNQHEDKDEDEDETNEKIKELEKKESIDISNNIDIIINEIIDKDKS